MIELIGYVGMMITILSFIFKDVNKIRITNGIACVVWIVYGFFKISYPIILVNLMVLVVHSYWLIKNKNND
jgi:hypothetical protein